MNLLYKCGLNKKDSYFANLTSGFLIGLSHMLAITHEEKIRASWKTQGLCWTCTSISQKGACTSISQNTRTMLATTLLIFLISTHMLCFGESKTEHVSSFTCSLSWLFHVRVLNEENRVLWAWFPWTKIESVGLDFHVQQPSPLDSISMCRNRVQWTRFPGLRGRLSSPKSSPLDSNC